MNWDNLLNPQRRKDKYGAPGQSGTNTGHGRAEIERDYDRILFCTPIRRLADKTQVFPLERNDSVRTRLTHSHEVSNLARGIGMRLAFEHKEIFGTTERCLERDVPALLAAIGLVHDLGNPPFGHQGEAAIRKWFENNKEAQPKDYSDDFLKFDGNSQTFRLITKLQILNDQFGLNLTYATLSAMLKYPLSSASIRESKIWNKHGFFKSEEKIVKDIWEETGLGANKRHPLTYIMEACDDIAYSVLDAEDIVKKGLASFYDLVNYLECWRDDKCPEDEVINNLLDSIKRKNTEYKKEKLSPAELNDMSMQMFRVFAIASLVNAAIESFIEKKDEVINANCTMKDLIGESKGDNLCCALKSFDLKWGYLHKSVLKLELEGNNYIQELMDMLWQGIHGRLSKSYNSQTPFGRYAYQKISENYRRVFEDPSNEMDEDYKEAQLLTDAISGMTDSYLIDLHDELINLKNDSSSAK